MGTDIQRRRLAALMIFAVAVVAASCSATPAETQILGDDPPEKVAETTNLVGSSAGWLFRSPSVKELAARKVVIDGPAAAKFGYVLVSKPRQFSAASYIVASGEVKRGGLTVGLQRAQSWVVQHTAHEGPFRIGIKVPADGEYQVVVANAVDSDGARNTVTVDSLVSVR
jgi:hypothetical protein